MKGKELLDFIQENSLQEYDIKIKVLVCKKELEYSKKEIITGKYIDENKKEVVLLVNEDSE